MTSEHDPTTIVSNALTLRPWRHGDEEFLVAALNDPEIVRFTVTIPQPYTLELAKQWVRELAGDGWRSGGAEFAIDLGDGLAVGSIAIRRVARESEVVGTVGYWVAPRARGRGLAGQALALLAPWAAEYLDLGQQELIHDLENIASCKSALSGCFEIDGIVRGGSHYRDGSPRDVERHRWVVPR
jgi:RimJ/RimL family protein N-acetyltransferase